MPKKKTTRGPGRQRRDIPDTWAATRLSKVAGDPEAVLNLLLRDPLGVLRSELAAMPHPSHIISKNLKGAIAPSTVRSLINGQHRGLQAGQYATVMRELLVLRGWKRQRHRVVPPQEMRE